MFADVHLALWPVLFSMQDEDMSESSAASEPDESDEPAVLVWWRLLRRECCFHIRHSVQVRPCRMLFSICQCVWLIQHDARRSILTSSERPIRKK